MARERFSVSQIRLFADLSPVLLRELDEVAYSAACQDGQIIMLEGDRAASVLFVTKGVVRVFRTNPDGREQTLIHLGPGDTLNIPAAFSSDQVAPASAIAVGVVRLLAVPCHDFRRVATATPEIALAVLRDLADRLRHLTDLAYDLSLRSVRARLARFLLAQSNADDTTPVRWTHEQIAAQVGTVREVVSRILRAFVKEGLIKIERQRITVLNLDALEAAARL